MDLLTPRRSPNSALPLHTQKQCTARWSSWGFPSLSLTTKGSWIHIWREGCQTSRQLSDASTPNHGYNHNENYRRERNRLLSTCIMHVAEWRCTKYLSVYESFTMTIHIILLHNKLKSQKLKKQLHFYCTQLNNHRLKTKWNNMHLVRYILVHSWLIRLTAEDIVACEWHSTLLMVQARAICRKQFQREFN